MLLNIHEGLDMRTTFGLLMVAIGTAVWADGFVLDSVSREQAELEKKQLAENQPRALTPAMAEFRKTAQNVEYPSGEFKLPGFLYRPKGDGPFPAVIWNHGSEKRPIAQPELAR